MLIAFHVYNNANIKIDVFIYSKPQYSNVTDIFINKYMSAEAGENLNFMNLNKNKFFMKRIHKNKW